MPTYNSRSQKQRNWGQSLQRHVNTLPEILALFMLLCANRMEKILQLYLVGTAIVYAIGANKSADYRSPQRMRTRSLFAGGGIVYAHFFHNPSSRSQTESQPYATPINAWVHSDRIACSTRNHSRISRIVVSSFCQSETECEENSLTFKPTPMWPSSSDVL